MAVFYVGARRPRWECSCEAADSAWDGGSARSIDKDWRDMIRRLATKPVWLIVAPAVVSFVVWAIPWPAGIRRGYAVKEVLSGSAALVLLSWYCLCALSGLAGWVVGKSCPPLRRLNEAADLDVYRVLTWIGGLGLLGTYALVQYRSPGLLVRAFQEHQFDLVRNQIPLSAGIQTLRYATIPTGAIALHGMVMRRERSGVHVLNIGLLLMNVLLASRLALLMALLLFVGLVVVRGRGVAKLPRRRVHTRLRLMLLVIAAFATLVLANYSRNANFYEQYYHTNNPLTMMLDETVAYVGSPTQVAVGTANAVEAGRNPASTEPIAQNTLQQMLPTFLSPAPGPHQLQQVNWYRATVSVDATLNSNSSLAAGYGMLGLWAFPAMAFTSAVAGFGMGHLGRYKSFMVLGSFVLGYCFLEVWRVNLFNEGIVSFILIALVISAAMRPKRGMTGSQSGQRRAIASVDVRMVPVALPQGR